MANPPLTDLHIIIIHKWIEEKFYTYVLFIVEPVEKKLTTLTFKYDGRFSDQDRNILGEQ